MRRQKDSWRGQKTWEFLQRKSGHWTPRARVLIVCEGKETEPRYFRALRSRTRLSTAEVEVCPSELGSHPSCVVDCAVSRRNAALKDKEFFDEVWCVFDRDDHERIHEALDRAGDCGIKVAFSNPCFELWFLLHFAKYSARELDRDEAVSQLKQHLPGYHKAMDVYGQLLPHQQRAVASAQQLRKYHVENGDKETKNPSTTVDRLVTELNNLAEMRRP